MHFEETDSIAVPLNHNDNYSSFNINIESSQVNNSDNVLIDYEKKIESLEKKLINNLDENSYSELIKLKSQLNRD